MSMSSGGGSTTPKLNVTTEKLKKVLTIEDVEIIEKKVTIEYPVLVEVPKEQIRWDTKIEEQVKYHTIIEDTKKYEVKEEGTIRYKVKDEETIRYLPIDSPIEKPIIVEKEYEKPVIVEKKYTVASVEDMENVQVLLKTIPQILKDLAHVKEKLDGIVSYKMVEKIIPAPRIEWIPTPTERIIWVDVKRERGVNDGN